VARRSEVISERSEMTPASAAASRRTGIRVGVALVAIAAVATLTALWVGGGRPASAPQGLPDPGLPTLWLLPFARLAADVCAIVTVGFLLAPAALIASRQGGLSTRAQQAARIASYAAIGWAVAAASLLVLTLSDVLAEPLGQALNPSSLISYVTQIPQGGAWAMVALLAVITAITAREADTSGSAWVALGLATLALLPPALTGHAATAGDHDVATSALVLHIASVVYWVGGLVAVSWYALGGGRDVPLAARRFSRLAGWAYVAIALSGVIGAVVRLHQLPELWSSGYGRLVMVKTGLFVALGVIGWWHRRRTLPELEAGRAGRFLRFALVEALIMGATVGVAAALARTAPPVVPGATSPSESDVVLGFTMPPAPTVWHYLTLWRLDVLSLGLLLTLGYFYTRWFLRLRRRGDGWPVGRLIAWYAGLLTAAIATTSGLATYGRIVFSDHMVQHMLLGMLAPVLLVLAAPITLALRALPRAGPNEPRGAREHLLALLHSRVIRVLTNPIVALLLFVSAPYLVYFSNLFEVAMRNHWAHEAMHVHFIVIGYLFYETLIGTDPLPHRASYPLRLLTLIASMPFHAFFAIALMQSHSVIASSYYALVDPSWAPNRLADQTGGAAFAWAFGELPALIALLVLLIQWSRADTREAKRLDRQADRDGDADLVAYNTMLSARSRADRRSRE
jgi:cytochrome c oxidase assembly factor CtaG/putative copper export protein